MGGWMEFTHICTYGRRYTNTVTQQEEWPFLSFSVWNLIISAAKFNNVLSMLIASIINLLLFHFNFIHGASLVIRRIITGGCLLHLYNDYKDWFYYVDYAGKDYAGYQSLKEQITSFNQADVLKSKTATLQRTTTLEFRMKTVTKKNRVTGKQTRMCTHNSLCVRSTCV